MITLLKTYRLQAVTVLVYLGTLYLAPERFSVAVANTWMYVREMLEILPAVFVLSGLLTVWVPPEAIMQHFGVGSGLRGKLASVLVGSVSAGPIYAAFPLTQSLVKKGASISNAVIIISAWAVVKIPMLIVEGRFLGVEFLMARYLFTIPAILLVGLFVASRVTADEIPAAEGTGDRGARGIEADRVEAILPGAQCGACGYPGCRAFAHALVSGVAGAEECVLLESDMADEVKRASGRAASTEGSDE